MISGDGVLSMLWASATAEWVNSLKWKWLVRNMLVGD